MKGYQMNFDVERSDDLQNELATKMAKYYSDRLSEQVRRGLKQAIEEGKTIGHAPVGYYHDRKHKVVVRDPVLFPMLQRAFKSVAAGLQDMRMLVGLVNSAGFRTKSGKPMDVQYMKKILRNPYYAGKIVNTLDKDRPLKNGIHEPMVTMDEFEKIQATLDGIT
jgi:hypothetical protein